MTQTLSRTQAARTARITRVAAAVFGVGAVALALAGLPERAEPGMGVGTGVPPGAQTPAGDDRGGDTGGDRPDTRWATIDAGGVAARLSLVSNAPRIATPEEPVSFQEPPEPTGAPEEERVVAGITDRVRYMGLIRFGDQRGALVRVDGRQRIVREGGSVGPPPDSPGMATLLFERVTPGTIVVSDGEAKAPIALEQREGPSLTMAEPGATDPAGLAGEQAGDQPGGSEEADNNAIRQRELDRRRRMMERQRNGQLGNNTRSAIQRPPVNRTFNMRNQRNDDQDQDR